MSSTLYQPPLLQSHFKLKHWKTRSPNKWTKTTCDITLCFRTACRSRGCAQSSNSSIHDNHGTVGRCAWWTYNEHAFSWHLEFDYAFCCVTTWTWGTLNVVLLIHFSFTVWGDPFSSNYICQWLGQRYTFRKYWSHPNVVFSTRALWLSYKL